MPLSLTLMMRSREYASSSLWKLPRIAIRASVTACPTRTISCCDPRIVLNPSRKTGWSSTMRIRIDLDETILDGLHFTILADVLMLWLASQGDNYLGQDCNTKLSFLRKARQGCC